jgi:hypothetical protein
VLEPEGTAVLVTPNRLTFGRPDEIIDPYYHVEYDPGELRRLCEPRFAVVEMRALFGSARYLAAVRRGAGGGTCCCEPTRCGCGGPYRGGRASASTR